MRLSIVFEVARWKLNSSLPASENLFEKIKSLVGKGYFLTFTNNPYKIGFNPRGVDIGNPKGFYGFPINQEFVETVGFLSFQSRRFIVIWKPADELNIIKWSDVKKLNIPRESFLSTKKLMNLGYDGVISSKNDGLMSGDMFSELVIFKPSNVEVLEVSKNTLLEDFESYKNKIEVERLERQKERIHNRIKQGKNDFWRDSEEVALNRYKNQHNFYKNRSRNVRKNIE